jgi:hypothetical protein
VEPVNFALPDREQYAIMAHDHLANFFGEVFILWRDGKAFRHGR